MTFATPPPQTRSTSWGCSSLYSNHRTETCRCTSSSLQLQSSPSRQGVSNQPHFTTVTLKRRAGARRRGCDGGEHMELLGTSGSGLCWRTCSSRITSWSRSSPKTPLTPRLRPAGVSAASLLLCEEPSAPCGASNPRRELEELSVGGEVGYDVRMEI